MYGHKFHSLNGWNTLDQKTLNQDKQHIIIWSYECKMQENLTSRNLKLGFHYVYTTVFLSVLSKTSHLRSQITLNTLVDKRVNFISKFIV